MTGLTTLRALAAGERPRGGEVLGPCKLEAFGMEYFSEEAIVQSFRVAPLQISDAAVVVETSDHLAVMDGQSALFADLFNGNIGRLWRLGLGEPENAERAIGVPFDADLMQSRGDLAARPEDHPDLSGEAYAAVENAGKSIARHWTSADGDPPFRTRSFLVRAFSDGGRTAALFAVHTLGSAAQRSVGFSYAAVLIDGGNVKIVRDAAGQAALEVRPWIPVVVA